MGSCCFTGHRDIPAAALTGLRTRLDDCLYALIDEGVYRFRAGGARGFDRIAAEQVLEMRRRFDFVQLELILPCHGQTRGWLEDDRRAYRRILAEADRAVFLQERYTAGCMRAAIFSCCWRGGLRLLQTHPGGGPLSPSPRPRRGAANHQFGKRRITPPISRKCASGYRRGLFPDNGAGRKKNAKLLAGKMNFS